MLTLNEIINASFRKANFSGYRTEDVDAFIDQVKDSYDALIKKTIEQKEANEALAAENAQLVKKVEILANKVEEYRTEEDEIKNALVSAQKLGEASIREARHKAEIIIKDANLKAERIIGTAKTDVVDEQKELERLKQTVSDFRAKLLGIYKEHLTMIDALPAKKDPAPKQEEAAEKEAENKPVPAPVAEPIREQTIVADGAPTSAEATQEFVVDASSFEAPEEDVPAQDRDLRYDVLKFGDDYDISEDK